MTITSFVVLFVYLMYYWFHLLKDIFELIKAMMFGFALKKFI